MDVSVLSELILNLLKSQTEALIEASDAATKEFVSDYTGMLNGRLIHLEEKVDDLIALLTPQQDTQEDGETNDA